MSDEDEGWALPELGRKTRWKLGQRLKGSLKVRRAAPRAFFCTAPRPLAPRAAPSAADAARPLHLQSAIQCLREMDQDDDVRGWGNFPHQMAQTQLLRHKDAEVKTLVACCLVDVLRLTAPDAPYDDETIKEICSLLVNQLDGLRHADTPAYAMQFYMLEQLNVVKIFVLLPEMEEDALCVTLFESFFEAIKLRHGSTLRKHFLSIMADIVNEAEVLAPELLDTVFAQIVALEGGSFAKRSFAPPVSLAKELLNGAIDAITPAVSGFFKQALAGGSDSGGDGDESAHCRDCGNLAYALAVLAPESMLHAIPLFGFQLEEQSIDARIDAVRLMTRLFCEEGSSLAELHQSTWKSFAACFSDSSDKIRQHMSGAVLPLLLQHHPKLIAELGDKLEAVMHDQLQDVRANAALAFCQSAKAQPKSVALPMLQIAAGRMKDRVAAVRATLLPEFCELYQVRTSSDSDSDEWQWVPETVFEALKLSSNARDSAQNRCIQRLVPSEETPVDVRAQRVLTLYSGMSATARIVLSNVMSGQTQLRSATRIYVAARAAAKTDSQDEENAQAVNAAIEQICVRSTDSKKMETLLKDLTESKDARLFKLVSGMLKQGITADEQRATGKELTKRARAFAGSNKATLDKFLTALQPVLLDCDVTKAIVKGLRAQVASSEFDMDADDDSVVSEQSSAACVDLIQAIAMSAPHLLAGSFADVSHIISSSDQDSAAESATSRGLIRALCTSGYVHVSEEADKVKDLVQVIVHMCDDGSASNSRHCVLSIASLCGLTKADESGADIDPLRVFGKDRLKQLVEASHAWMDEALGEQRMDNGEEADCTSRLQMLQQVDRINGFAFTEKNRKLHQRFILECVLGINQAQSQSKTTQPLGAKLTAINLLTSQFLSSNVEVQKTPPVVEVLKFIVNGQLATTGSDDDDDAVKLVAALALADLGPCVRNDTDLLLSVMNGLALACRTQSLQGRVRLSKKLSEVSIKMQPSFFALFALCFEDVEDKDVQEQLQRVMDLEFRKREVAAKQNTKVKPECCLPWLIHSVVHSPANENASDVLQKMKAGNFQTALSVLAPFIKSVVHPQLGGNAGWYVSTDCARLLPSAPLLRLLTQPLQGYAPSHSGTRQTRRRNGRR